MASLVCRGKSYYLEWRIGSRIKRRSLRTTSTQIAREKLRQFESAQFKGEELAGPTRTKLNDILTRYAEHVRVTKTPKSAQTDVYYLRQMFWKTACKRDPRREEKIGIENGPTAVISVG
jgi:capsule polysaccharide export protein KpsC/LpsZ